MEEILEVKTASVVRVSEVLGDDASAADVQADESGNDADRTRYQRMFWEPTVENKVCALIALRRIYLTMLLQ